MQTPALGFLTALLLFSSTLAYTQTIQIDFGSMYGQNRSKDPTTITDGAGIFNKDTEISWFCLDVDGRSPSDTLARYTLVNHVSALSTGVWGSFSNRTKTDILTAVENIFYHHQDRILSDETGAGAYYDYQMALWYLTASRDARVWNGRLNQDAIDKILHWNWGHNNDRTPWGIEKMLETALTPGSGTEIYWAVPVSNDLQPIAFIVTKPVPEPAGALLLFISGTFFFMRRRK